MSDAIDAIAEAMARQKRLAARLLTTKEELAPALDRLREQRASIAELGPEADPMRAELDGRIAAATTELAAVTHDLDAALKELEELRRMARTAKAPPVALPLDEDEILRSPEETALENARAHIRDLEARVRVGEESRPPAEEPAARPAAPAPEDADAKARAEFEELRARRGGPPKKTM